MTAPAAERGGHPVHDRLAGIAAPRPDDVVVDLGCGPGGTLAALAGRHASLRLVGVDLHATRLVEAASWVGATAAVMLRADLTRPLPLRDAAQPCMGHIDPYAARRLPGLATAAAGLIVDGVDGHVLAAHRLDGAGQARLDEIANVVRGHIRRGLVDLTPADVDSWWDQLAAADARGGFCFAETALIASTHRPGCQGATGRAGR